MSEKQKNNKTGWKQYISTAFIVLISVAAGFFIAAYSDREFGEGVSSYEKMLNVAVMLLGIYAAVTLQIIIHEAGHLVFGLLSGYKFSSFRIFNFMWLKENGKIRLRRLSLAGTSGQCLMTPPDMKDGKMPLVLYNLGGSIANIIISLISLGLFFIFKDISLLSTLLIVLSAIGFWSAAVNGIPLKLGITNNDGYNALDLMRNPQSIRAFWVQLTVNGQIANGVKLKDMPDEWFTFPSDEEMKNSMVATTGVFTCNRLMDAGKFGEADELMAHMLEINCGMVGLHRNLLICDRIYVELITEGRREIVDKMLTTEQKKFMQSMKKFPSVLRTEYVYALLCENDIVKADQIKERFEKYAKTYPYQNDVQAERELMELAQKKLACKE